MATTISIHSFRGGTGKSNTSANIASLLAADGKRVGVVDTDIQSPGIHILFGLDMESVNYSLNDYLWGNCEIHEAAYDVSQKLIRDGAGKFSIAEKSVYLIPSSINAGEITRVLREGYDVGLLSDGFFHLTEELNLDVLLIDTHPGLNEETLLSIAVSDALAIIMRPDQQDYEGTAVTVEVARKLDVPRLMLVVNKVPESYDAQAVKAKVERTYGCTVGAIIPHSNELMALASAGVFAMQYPEHPITGMYKQVAAALTA